MTTYLVDNGGSWLESSSSKQKRRAEVGLDNQVAKAVKDLQKANWHAKRIYERA